MAKTYKRRRYYRNRGRWSANIKTLTNSAITATPNSSFYGVTDLCLNPAQSDSTVSQQYTVKNVELSYELELVGTSTLWSYIEGLVAYIMYVPQGMTVTETYPNFHPEYIMAMKFLGSPNRDEENQPGRLPCKIKTRLARRLQTGDKLVLLITGTSNTATQQTLNFNGIIRWWTKAN